MYVIKNFYIGDSCDMIYNAAFKRNSQEFNFIRVPLDRCAFQTLQQKSLCREQFLNSLKAVKSEFNSNNDFLLISFWLDKYSKNTIEPVKKFLSDWSRDSLKGINNNRVAFAVTKYSSSNLINDAMCNTHEFKKSQLCKKVMKFLANY